MDKKVIILDTSILCVWLKVPGLETTGSKDDIWNYERVNSHIESEKEKGALLALPIASVIETGNHIAHAKGPKMNSANKLKEFITNVADNKYPWQAIFDQKDLWNGDKLKELANQWIKGVETEKQSIGDTAIVEVAKYYAGKGFKVEIFTGDYGLKQYEYRIAEQTPKYTTRRNRK